MLPFHFTSLHYLLFTLVFCSPFITPFFQEMRKWIMVRFFPFFSFQFTLPFMLHSIVIEMNERRETKRTKRKKNRKEYCNALSFLSFLLFFQLKYNGTEGTGEKRDFNWKKPHNSSLVSEVCFVVLNLNEKKPRFHSVPLCFFRLKLNTKKTQDKHNINH